MTRVLFISNCVPPVSFGPSTLFKRLFRNFPADSYVVMTSRRDPGTHAAEDADRLPCRYYYAGASDLGTITKWSSIREWLDVVPMVIKGFSVVRKEKISRILVHPISGNFLLASYIVSKLTGIPLYVYLLDHFTASQTYKLRKLMAALIEKTVVRSARKVFVMSEALRDFYDSKYNIDTELLRHPIDLAPRSSAGLKTGASVASEKRTIVFTGMIYEAQLDALQNLVQAVNEMQDVELHVYSQRAVPKLISLGLSGENVIHHGYVDHAEISHIQRNADILFLPMAFNSPYPDIIRTASPAKLPEYLASGTPILVHAPEDAYISWYARKYGWGLVVDKPEPKLLREAIRNLLQDKVLAGRLVESALSTVQMHDESRVAGILKSHLGVQP